MTLAKSSGDDGNTQVVTPQGTNGKNAKWRRPVDFKISIAVWKPSFHLKLLDREREQKVRGYILDGLSCNCQARRIIGLDKRSVFKYFLSWGDRGQIITAGICLTIRVIGKRRDGLV
ncbi:hypothetical protein ElyMa_004729600 [Elysia marginata]|uniref:NTR domain-containing protein n=1 Tax=Elysia marginata TaxID=1093978 RepID=A0AAV4IAB7_9GAST|nr:hypothetical protein ElyMa_004729600 [Elysia marginata]